MPKTVKSPEKFAYRLDQLAAIRLCCWTGCEPKAVAHFPVGSRATGYWKRPRGFQRYIKNKGNQS